MNSGHTPVCGHVFTQTSTSENVTKRINHTLASKPHGRVLRALTILKAFFHILYMNNIFSILKPQHFHHFTWQFYVKKNIFYVISKKRSHTLKLAKHEYTLYPPIRPLTKPNLKSEIEIKIIFIRK